MHIINDGTSKKRLRGNYDGLSFVGCNRATLDKYLVSKRARLENWPRLDKHVWNLVAVMLTNMGYGP